MIPTLFRTDDTHRTVDRADVKGTGPDSHVVRRPSLLHPSQRLQDLQERQHRHQASDSNLGYSSGRFFRTILQTEAGKNICRQFGYRCVAI